MKNVDTVYMLNPTSIEQSFLRTSLLPGLLQVVKYNYDRFEKNLQGFEIGRVHFKDKKGYKEQSLIGIIITGEAFPRSFDRENLQVDFFDLKGLVENMLLSQAVKHFSFEKSTHAFLHPGRQANVIVNGQDMGVIGQVHPEVVLNLDVDQEIFYAEVNLHDLYPYVNKEIKMQSLPLYPGSTRDVTFPLSLDVPLSVVFDEIKEMKERLLTSVDLKDIYTGDGVPQGMRFVTLHFLYRDENKTLELHEVNEAHEKILKKSPYLSRS
jgi:phenylalanyl-tRNA synthetase beta chain